MLDILLYASYGILFIVAGFMIHKLRFAMKHFTPPIFNTQLGTEVDMPSVTVCIPARNEMHAVAECLEKVIASDYQKLEIIVLDDVSGDDTSSLIKAYAHEGVRFVAGKSLPAGWLGKNHALQGLLNEASGSYVLFMDVDTRITPNAISNIVRYALSQRASMVSVLPRREDGLRPSVWLSPLRYFWEIMFHSKSFPATASNAWLVKRDTLLKRFGGFENLKAVVQPESYIAASLSLTNEYRFLISTLHFGVAYEKKWRSQLITSTRLLSPLLKNRMPFVVLALLNIALLLVPATVVMSIPFAGFGLIQTIGSLIAILYAGIYGWYVYRVWRKAALIGALLWPFILIQEFILIIASVFQYSRKTVKWKGRSFLQAR